MNTLSQPFLLIAILLLICAAISAVNVFRMETLARLSRSGVAISTAPNLVFLLLFYSLAMHMYHSLGGWPQTIGQNGFPNSLAAHSTVSTSYFGYYLLGTLFVWPIAYALCLLIRRLQTLVPYLGIYVIGFVVAVTLMWAAPSPFLN